MEKTAVAELRTRAASNTNDHKSATAYCMFSDYTLFIWQVAVLGCYAGSIVLQHSAEPGVTEVA